MSESKHAKVRAWLASGNTLTPLEAFEKWNIMRLASIVFRLKKEGMDIENIGTDYAIYIKAITY